MASLISNIMLAQKALNCVLNANYCTLLNANGFKTKAYDTDLTKTLQNYYSDVAAPHSVE
jgi:hypothetical protein